MMRLEPRGAKRNTGMRFHSLIWVVVSSIGQSRKNQSGHIPTLTVGRAALLLLLPADYCQLELLFEEVSELQA